MSSSGSTSATGSSASTSVPSSTATSVTFSRAEFQSAVQTELAKALAASLPGPSGLSAGKPIVFYFFLPLVLHVYRAVQARVSLLFFSLSLSLLPRHQVPVALKARYGGVCNLSVLTSTLSPSLAAGSGTSAPVSISALVPAPASLASIPIISLGAGPISSRLSRRFSRQ